jgi:hypothetical protein
MSTKNSPVTVGKPWTNAAVFDDFESADSLRKQILEKNELDVKVHLQERGFVVKTRSRNVPDVVAEVQAVVEAEVKKPRASKPKQASRAAATVKNKK